MESSSSEDSDLESHSPSSTISKYFKSLLAVLILWQFTFKVSNAAFTALLQIIKQFFIYVGHSLGLISIQEIGESIPLTLATVYRLMDIQSNDFETYVVCPVCYSIYNYHSSYEMKFGQKESKLCSHVANPKHIHRNQRKPCGATLLKKVRKKGGYDLEPFKVYPYKSLRSSIERLVQRKGFLEKCEKWRYRKVLDGYICDVFDGAVWKSFTENDKENFLVNRHCYLLTLNVDWFQPFEQQVVYSVGAIYLTLQNLPRDERNKLENVILIGVIPGPSEPKKTINSFLTPLILELKEAWSNGFIISTGKSQVCIKLALSCVTCDIPATRKVCGFLGHNSELGCNKCWKKFNVGFAERTDFSGYDREEPRTLEQHRACLEDIQRQVNKTKQKSKESGSGVRYSVLMDLPYFDPCSFVAVDTMHNLYLGTGKHVFTTWVKTGTLTSQDLLVIEKRIKSFFVPVDVGRLPSNIKSSYKGFTANQWKNWITIYSLVILKDLLPPAHLQCWQLFVRSCIILSAYCTRSSDFNAADVFLQQFCRQFQSLYGNSHCTFNMHLHLHLKQTCLDFGPPHATWCYAFERFNGILGSYFTNNKIIEPQIMRKFTQHQMILNSDCAENADIGIFQFHKQQQNKVESMGNTLYLLRFTICSLSELPSFCVSQFALLVNYHLLQ